MSASLTALQQLLPQTQPGAALGLARRLPTTGSISLPSAPYSFFTPSLLLPSSWHTAPRTRSLQRRSPPALCLQRSGPCLHTGPGFSPSCTLGTRYHFCPKLEGESLKKPLRSRTVLGCCHPSLCSFVLAMAPCDCHCPRQLHGQGKPGRAKDSEKPPITTHVMAGLTSGMDQSAMVYQEMQQRLKKKRPS